jgi:hypothetical protein
MAQAGQRPGAVQMELLHDSGPVDVDGLDRQAEPLAHGLVGVSVPFAL